MAKLFPTLVAVKKISSSVPRSTFPEERLERAARLILKAGGSITPPVVRKINFNAFQVIEGHFEYYAAVKAREIDPREGEMLGVFSIDPTSEDAVSEDILTQQIEVFKNVATTPVPDSISPVSPALEQRVNNLETRFEEKLQKIQADYNSHIKDLQERMEDLEDRTPKPHPLLEALNHSSENELMSKISSMSSINKKVREGILEALKEREQRPFLSFENLIERVNGLGHKTVIKAIDEWTSRGF